MEEQMTTARKFSIIIICAAMVIALIYSVNVSTTITKMSAACMSIRAVTADVTPVTFGQL